MHLFLHRAPKEPLGCENSVKKGKRILQRGFICFYFVLSDSNNERLLGVLYQKRNYVIKTLKSKIFTVQFLEVTLIP